MSNATRIVNLGEELGDVCLDCSCRPHSDPSRARLVDDQEGWIELEAVEFNQCGVLLFLEDREASQEIVRDVLVDEALGVQTGCAVLLAEENGVVKSRHS